MTEFNLADRVLLPRSSATGIIERFVTLSRGVFWREDGAQVLVESGPRRGQIVTFALSELEHAD